MSEGVPKYPFMVVVDQNIGGKHTRIAKHFEKLGSALLFREATIKSPLTRAVTLYSVMDEYCKPNEVRHDERANHFYR